ncbi:MAG: UvrD-helicase domain-containing protein [Chloroflexi bacterium]|nr:UvrD-helicase domain-containing protein [Chloroflexota bacterium]
MTINHHLNSQQCAAVETDARYAIVLAGPGSGKTRVLTERIKTLVHRGVPPEQILAITFTRKAALEMAARLNDTLPYHQARKVTARTFHSLGRSIIRAQMKTFVPLLAEHSNTQLIKLSGEFSIYDNAEHNRVIDQVLRQIRREKLLKSASEYIRRCKERQRLPDDPKLRGSAVLRGVYEQYQAVMYARNALDFDDLLLYPLLLFQWSDDVLRWYQKRYPYVLVDEFQDTNDTQFKLTRLLAGHPLAHLFIVGDEDQCIYRFRQADYRYIGYTQSAFPDHRVYLLEQNFRSLPGIVHAANRLISHNGERVPKQLWADESSKAAVICVETLDDENDEAEAVVQAIHESNASGVSLGEIAVLYRYHALAKAVESALLRNRIPYKLAQRTWFYGRMEIRDVVSYLQFICNGDRNAFGRLVSRPRRGIGSRTLEAIYDAVGDENLLAWLLRVHDSGTALMSSGDVITPPRWREMLRDTFTLNVSSSAAEGVWKLSRQIAKLYTLRDEVGNLIKSVIPVVKSYWSAQGNLSKRVENVRELLTMVDATTSLQDLLDEISMSALQNGELGEDCVTLCTLHAAKGLEWDVVNIVAAEDDICPHWRSDDVDDERRLFYVGVTRARKRLYLFNTFCRTASGNTDTRKPSPFIREMGI